MLYIKAFYTHPDYTATAFYCFETGVDEVGEMLRDYVGKYMSYAVVDVADWRDAFRGGAYNGFVVYPDFGDSFDLLVEGGLDEDEYPGVVEAVLNDKFDYTWAPWEAF